MPAYVFSSSFMVLLDPASVWGRKEGVALL